MDVPTELVRIIEEDARKRSAGATDEELLALNRVLTKCTDALTIARKTGRLETGLATPVFKSWREFEARFGESAEDEG